MKRKYIKTLAFGMALTCAVPAMAQNKVVQGTVLDDLGEPVIGATVKVAGTKTAVITDMDGNYKLSVPKGGKVTVSYIGLRMLLPMAVLSSWLLTTRLFRRW